MLLNTMFGVFVFGCLFVFAECGPSNDSYRDQFCTDPRTMRKHPAYSEWADVYSCTKHRCQPGGRSLAIYTVGCKRVEAPESAIECEEVVEDTNMQFPFCCTRLRCLVVVRGEVWTRVLGQPWEILPAAPWSHMYKMKKPPPGTDDGASRASLGPIYELSPPEPIEKDKRRTKPPQRTESSDDDTAAPAARDNHNAPDIVIALSAGTSSDKEDDKNENKLHRKSMSKRNRQKKFFEQIVTTEEPTSEEKITTNLPPQESGLDLIPLDPQTSEEKIRVLSTATVSPQSLRQNKPTEAISWDLQPTWNKPDPAEEINEQTKPKAHIPRIDEQEDVKASKNNLQALVDAIGTRMKDIQTVVEKMSEKVKESKEIGKGEKDGEDEIGTYRRSGDVDNLKIKTYSGTTQNDNRLLPHKTSRYLRPKGPSTEAAVDENGNGYFSDASNSVMRRNTPKEPVVTYMAPVETHRSKPNERSDEKHTKRKIHRTRRTKPSKRHKKHRKEPEKHKKLKVTSIESDRNVQASNGDEESDAVLMI